MEELLRTQKVASPLNLVVILSAILGGGFLLEQDKKQEKKQDAPKQVIEQVLKRCHNVLQGRMDNAYLELRKDGTKDTYKVVLGTGPKGPYYLRSTFPDGSTSILNEKHAGCYVLADGLWARTEFTADRQQRLKDLNSLLHTALLRPLYKARKVERTGPSVYRLMLKGGKTWRLELDPKTNLPKSLTGPGGKVSFDEHKATGVTYLPKVVTLGRLGKHHFNLIDSDFVFPENYFRALEAPVDRSKQQVIKVSKPGLGAFYKPRLLEVTARLNLLIEDSGDWASRIDLLNKNMAVLVQQGQMNIDLVAFSKMDGKRYMAIPFVPDPALGNATFVRRRGQKVGRQPRQIVARVYPQRQSTWEGDVAAGHKQLLRYIEKMGLQASGPLRVIPLLAPEKGTPKAKELAEMKILLEIPVRKK